MPLKIAIIFCNNIIGVALQRVVEEQFFDADVISLSFGNINSVSEIKPDLLISDYHSLMLIPKRSIELAETSILLIGAGCVPCITNTQLLGLVSLGVAGILTEDANSIDFVKAIKSIINGELWFDRKKLRLLLCDMNRGKCFNPENLTKREKDIVRLICNGYKNKRIMQELNLSEQSVKSHLNRINKKIGVSDRLQLAIHVIKRFPAFLKGA